jgi:hypothetical protein
MYNGLPMLRLKALRMLLIMEYVVCVECVKGKNERKSEFFGRKERIYLTVLDDLK